MSNNGPPSQDRSVPATHSSRDVCVSRFRACARCPDKTQTTPGQPLRLQWGIRVSAKRWPVLFQKLMTFIRQRIEALQAKPIQVHYTHVEMLERGDAYIHLGED